MLQLGIPNENVTALNKAIEDNREVLVIAAKSKTIRLSKIEGLEDSESEEKAVDYKLSMIVGDSNAGTMENEETSVLEPLDLVIHLNMKVSSKLSATETSQTELRFASNKDKFLSLSKGLKEALELMKNQ
jgi:hypothetical protein